MRHFDVNFFNYDKLSKLPGNMNVYQAKDKCPVKYLRTCSAPKVLPVKINCKVMIIRNLENGLVNRLTGTVIHMDADNIYIEMMRMMKWITIWWMCLQHQQDGICYT